MSQYVLVHGAWLGGWCWGRVAARLRAAGHDVFAPSLTGLGDRSHLLNAEVNLSTHIDDICNIIAWENLEDVVLCGHSYGGFVITGVADKLMNRISALHYLDALIPEDGQSMYDTIPVEYRDMFDAGEEEGDGFSVPPISAEDFGVNDGDREWVDSKQSNQSIASFQQPIALTGAHLQITDQQFIWASNFEHPSTRDNYERLRNDPAWNVISLACGHHIMIDMPDELADILMNSNKGSSDPKTFGMVNSSVNCRLCSIV